MQLCTPDNFGGTRQSQKIDRFTHEKFYFDLQNTLFWENKLTYPTVTVLAAYALHPIL